MVIEVFINNSTYIIQTIPYDNIRGNLLEEILHLEVDPTPQKMVERGRVCLFLLGFCKYFYLKNPIIINLSKFIA